MCKRQAAVVDDDIAGAERGQVGQSGTALVTVGLQVEVDRQAGAQLVQAAEQALRVMGRRRGRAVAVVHERAGQVQLRAVDGEGAVAVPQRGRTVPGHLGEHRAMEPPEHFLVDLGAGLANRRGRDRPRLRQGQLQPAALLPQVGQDRAVGPPLGREHQPEHEQDHQQLP